MCTRNTPQKGKASMGCLSETAQITNKKRSEHWMYHCPHPSECVRETPCIKMKAAQDV